MQRDMMTSDWMSYVYIVPILIIQPYPPLSPPLPLPPALSLPLSLSLSSPSASLFPQAILVYHPSNLKKKSNTHVFHVNKFSISKPILTEEPIPANVAHTRSFKIINQQTNRVISIVNDFGTLPKNVSIYFEHTMPCIHW